MKKNDIFHRDVSENKVEFITFASLNNSLRTFLHLSEYVPIPIKI